MYYAYSKFVSAPLVLFFYYVYYLLFLLPCIVVTSIKNCDFEIVSVILLYSFYWVSSLKLHSQHLSRVKSNPTLVPLAVIWGEGSYTLGRLSIDRQLALSIQGFCISEFNQPWTENSISEHLRILVPTRVPKTNIPQIPRDNCSRLNCFHSFPGARLPPGHQLSPHTPLFHPETFTLCGSFLAQAGDRIWRIMLMVNVTNDYMFILYFIPLDWKFLVMGALYCLLPPSALKTMANVEQPFHKYLLDR